MDKLDRKKYDKGAVSKQPTQKASGITLESIEAYRVTLNSNIPPPEYVVKIDNVNKFSKGNISLWRGKAKSKKTFALTMFSTVVSGGINLSNKFISVSGVPEKIGYFDTEQALSDVHRVVKRLDRLGGKDEMLMMYGLRPFSPAERMQAIDMWLQKHGKDLSVLIIDGVRDLLMNINDPVESTEVTSNLMRWSYDYNIHIAALLHENKSDGSSRGHIGTELDNKAEVVIRIEVDTQDKNISWVREVFGRGKGAEDFPFTITDQGLPEIIESMAGLSSDGAPF